LHNSFFKSKIYLKPISSRKGYSTTSPRSENIPKVGDGFNNNEPSNIREFGALPSFLMEVILEPLQLVSLEETNNNYKLQPLVETKVTTNEHKRRITRTPQESTNNNPLALTL